MKSVLFEADWRLKRSPMEERDEIFAPRIYHLTEAINSSGRNLRILDAACANGNFAKFFQSHGHRVVPCDISFTAMSLAREHNQVRDGAVCNVEMLPFSDNSFDAIWFGECLASLENTHAAMSEFNRVLKPGGWMALTTPYYGRLKNVYIALFCFDRHYYPEDYRIRHFTKASLMRVLAHNGFAPRQWKGIGRFLWFWKSQYVLATKENAPKAKPHWHRESAVEHRDYQDSVFNSTGYFEKGRADPR